jgi:regulator of protease activity HflC (stomatin/prohibitin superfamily)
MSLSQDAADLLPSAPLSQAPQLTRRLTWLYGVYAGVVAVLLLAALFPLGGLSKLKGIAGEFLLGGLGVVALSAILLALLSLIATGLMANSRLYLRRTEAQRLAGELDSGPPSLFTPLWRLGPGFLAREGQAVVLPLGTALIALLAWRLWPTLGAPVAPEANLAAALIIGLAFPSLIAERMMNAFPAEQMPEAPGVRRVLLIVTVILGIGGVAEIGRSLGFAWVVWADRAAVVVTVLIALEWTLRALARMFLPTPSVDAAKAASDSLLAALLTGGARAPGVLIRTHLGLDFTRSWALSYLSKAAGPALVGTLLLCWALSGVKLLGDDQRGVYERFGAPVAVLGPGFHVMLPWPLGRMRPVEYGVTHTIAVGAEQGPDAYEKSAKAERIGAEDIPQANMNRLWDTAHATEAEYLVASQAQGQQGFQEVNGEILVIYRTGLSDEAAMQSVYGSDNQTTVVQQESNRLMTRFFSSHTLDQVLGGQREGLQETLRADLQGAVNADHAGVDIVAVLIDAIHPPAGAAAAYHSVQAAEINADASVAQATAHATRTAGEAQQEAHQATTAAEATAVEKVQAATGDAYQFNADRNAYRASPPAFLLERRARNLTPALRGVRLMVVDHRLSKDQTPIIDMRTGGTAMTGTSSAPQPLPSADQPTPGTSTEGPPPPATSEQAAEDAARGRGAEK